MLRYCADNMAKAQDGKKVKAKLIDKKGEQDIAVTTPDLTVKVNRTTGLISQYTYRGKSLLGEGEYPEAKLLACSYR